MPAWLRKVGEVRKIALLIKRELRVPGPTCCWTASFHHGSTRMHLLAMVISIPIPPALRDAIITLNSGLPLNSCMDASLWVNDISPVSRAYPRCSFSQMKRKISIMLRNWVKMTTFVSGASASHAATMSRAFVNLAPGIRCPTMGIQSVMSSSSSSSTIMGSSNIPFFFCFCLNCRCFFLLRLTWLRNQRGRDVGK